MVYPNVNCKIKSDSFSKENNKGIILIGILFDKINKFKSNNERYS